MNLWTDGRRVTAVARDLDGDSPQDSFETGAGNSFRNIREELQAELAETEVAFL